MKKEIITPLTKEQKIKDFKMKEDSCLQIGGKSFSSRLMVGTGKYKSSEVMIESLANTESEIVTVAVRRIQNNQNGENLLEKID